jgi:hypothetical protein
MRRRGGDDVPACGSLLPEGEKDQDEGVTMQQNNLKRPNPLTPSLSPPGRGWSIAAA